MNAGSGSRYQFLDAWRGVAALGVLGFHSINGLDGTAQSWMGALVWHGWMGVYIFFPISGYCILAASHSPANHSVGAFLQRRWRRIFPTYWASIALVVVITIVFAPFSTGSPWLLMAPGWKWLSIVTLTQTLAGIPNAISPVYWSLCYEEQFYLLIAATMLFASRWRPGLLLGITGIAALVHSFPARVSLPPGLFIDQWLGFAVGLAVYGWFDERYGRRWSMAMLGLAIAAEAVTRGPELAISLAAAVLFIAMRPYDRALAGSRAGRLLGAAGTISYSLYLTHVPIAGRIVNFSRRYLPQAEQWWPLVVMVAAAVAIAFATLFYLAVERRFQNARVVERSAAPSLAVA